MIKITLNQIKENEPCRDGWKKLLQSLGKRKADDTEVTFSYIADTCGVTDALWCLRVLGNNYIKERCYVLAAIADSVSHLNTDKKANDCIKAIRDFGDGKITVEQLNSHAATAHAAANAVWAAAAVANAAHERENQKKFIKEFLG